MDAIDRLAALEGAKELRAALGMLEAARHRMAVAYAASDACDMAEIIPPLANIMVCVSVKIAQVEAQINGTDLPYPKLRLVKG